MDFNAFRKIIFKFAVFILVVCSALLFMADTKSPQYVVIVMTMIINLVLIALILFLPGRKDED